MMSEDNKTSMGAKFGPGYKSPLDAMNGPKEKVMYTVLISCGNTNEPDCLATIDIDPDSSTYCKVIHKLKMKYVGDELHHFGWNICSSCCNDRTKSRRFLILPGLKSSRIYIVDTIQQKAPKIHKIIEPEIVKEQANLSGPHTVHCLPNGNVMISFLGDRNGNAPGGFLLLSEDFETLSRWGETDSNKLVTFNYDFWYQPFHNVMVSSEWTVPVILLNGFDPIDIKNEKYGKSLYFWNWAEQKMIKKFDLGNQGLMPLEVRFHHDPKSSHGFVGSALGGSIWHWWKSEENEWKIEKAIFIEPANTKASPLPIPPFVADLVISMDDKFLYFTNWLHGDVRQYDITNPFKPKLVGQVWCGGLVGKEFVLNGKKITAGPQMIQLSLDGKRLYVTNSFFSKWDDQFYPDLAKNGSFMLKINCDTEKGGMTIDEGFGVDFGSLENGPYRAHEMRYLGGDCTSDIWIA